LTWPDHPVGVAGRHRPHAPQPAPGQAANVAEVKRLLAVLRGVMAWPLLIGGPGAAAADPVDDAVSALRADHLYVAPGVPTKVDQSAVKRAIGDAPTYIAVLPESAGAPAPLSLRIGQALGSGTVGVVAGHNFEASSNLLCAGEVQATVSRVKSDNRAALEKAPDEVTKLLTDFASDVIVAPRVGRECAAGTAAQTASKTDTDTGSAWPWVLGVGAVGVAGAAGGGAVLMSRRRKRQRLLEGRRADVLSLYDRLGADVQNLDPKDDAVARQALADASERYTATGGLLAHADTEGEYDAARRTALEGLYAARTAREALGLDLGPELPPISPTQGEQLTEERDVTVGDKTYQGHPQYTPGAPYYYGGGSGVPGGWYSFPFWETLLLSSVLTGGFGGWGGGGFESGYDRGYEAGQDAGQADPGGGDWDSSGGGWDTSGGGWDSSGGGFDGGGFDGGGSDTGGGW
jgi:hypothetical protein